MTNGGTEQEVLTLWDRRMVQAIETAQAARKGVVLLRVVAAVVSIVAIVGSALLSLSLSDRVFSDDTGLNTSSLPDRYEWGQFLGSIAGPLAMAGLLVAASYLLAVYAARLDMDIVLADDEEVRRMEASGEAIGPDGDDAFRP